MSKNKRGKNSISEEELALFHSAIQHVKPLTQDRHFHTPKNSMKKIFNNTHPITSESNEVFYFSDEFQPLLNTEGATYYLRPGSDHYELKKLRRGDYHPDLFLDLHGVTQEQAKKELAALITACLQQHIHCACVMHGYGKYILKQKVPLWLAQHPSIIAFHQAPKKWGGSAALLLLIENSL